MERSNSNRMERLTSDKETYVSVDGGVIQDFTHREKLLSNFMAPHKLELKAEAQVMLIKNVDDTLVNGSMGRVLRFVDPYTFGANSDPEVSGVVASVASAQSLKKSASNPATVGAKLYPVVEFVLPQDRKRTVLVMPEIWKVELPNGEVQVSRTQVRPYWTISRVPDSVYLKLPLILSWAMSIHKSQGQTLQRVKVDLGRVFEKGQAYVALSRATTLEGLQVLNFDAAKVKESEPIFKEASHTVRQVQAHPKVVAWSKTLTTAL